MLCFCLPDLVRPVWLDSHSSSQLHPPPPLSLILPPSMSFTQALFVIVCSFRAPKSTVLDLWQLSRTLLGLKRMLLSTHCWRLHPCRHSKSLSLIPLAILSRTNHSKSDCGQQRTTCNMAQLYTDLNSSSQPNVSQAPQSNQSSLIDLHRLTGASKIKIEYCRTFFFFPII